MLNKFIGIGNLTKDPVFKELNNDKCVCILSVAINLSKEDKSPLYIDVQYWDNIAKNCNTYLKKGRPVFIEGKIAINSWEDKGGNKRQKFYCKGESIRFLNSEQKNEKQSPVKQQENKEVVAEDEELADIPF